MSHILSMFFLLFAGCSLGPELLEGSYQYTSSALHNDTCGFSDDYEVVSDIVVVSWLDEDTLLIKDEDGSTHYHWDGTTLSAEFVDVFEVEDDCFWRLMESDEGEILNESAFYISAFAQISAEGDCSADASYGLPCSFSVDMDFNLMD